MLEGPSCPAKTALGIMTWHGNEDAIISSLQVA
jgi:hypothetical protein